MADVKKTATALCRVMTVLSELGLVVIWIGAVRVEEPLLRVRDADAAGEFEKEVGGRVGVGVADPGGANIESIVGRRAAPRGDCRKSDGRSKENGL